MKHFLRNLRLADKLVLLVAAVSSLVLSLAVFSLFWLQQKSGEHEVEQDLLSLFGIASQSARHVLAAGDSGAAQTLVDSLAYHHNLSSVFLIAPDDRILARQVHKNHFSKGLRLAKTLADLTRSCQEESPFAGSPVRCGDWLMLLRPLAEDSQTGYLCFLADDRHLQGHTTWFAQTSFAVFGGSGLLALLLACWLQRFLSRPIGEVTRAMAQVAEGSAPGLRLEVRGADEVGQLAAGFNNMLSRIEDRDKALNAAHDALHAQARTQLRTLEKALATTNVGVTITDPEGVIIYANPAEARMHGYAADELLGRRANCLGPEELRRPFDLAKAGTWQRETLNVRRDGTLFPVHLVSDLVADDAGRPQAVITICEDITERRAAGAGREHRPGP